MEDTAVIEVQSTTSEERENQPAETDGKPITDPEPPLKRRRTNPPRPNMSQFYRMSWLQISKLPRAYRLPTGEATRIYQMTEELKMYEDTAKEAQRSADHAWSQAQHIRNDIEDLILARIRKRRLLAKAAGDGEADQPRSS